VATQRLGIHAIWIDVHGDGLPADFTVKRIIRSLTELCRRSARKAAVPSPSRNRFITIRIYVICLIVRKATIPDCVSAGPRLKSKVEVQG
jgi:hypothetical protein